jgi:prephenate dehydratase
MKKIAIQGIAGSFHEEAARKYFSPEEIEIVECRSFRGLCQAIDRDEVDMAVMAIENSTTGSILDNYSLIREFHLRIIGEIYIRIQQNLIMLPGGRKENIRAIYTHPVAMKQCDEYLEKYFPDVERIDNMDTAAACKLLLDKNLTDAAAIAGTQAAELFGLQTVEKSIETNKKNYTRFWALSKRNVSTAGVNKASIEFSVGHYCGALAKALNIFARNKINLNKIQSVPVLGRPNEYTMHVDVEFDSEADYNKAINAALKEVSSLSIIGEYVKGEIN